MKVNSEKSTRSLRASVTVVGPHRMSISPFSIIANRFSVVTGT